MTQKELYVQTLRSLPQGLEDKLSVSIPSLEGTWKPTTPDDAQIVCGILAHNINNILQMYEGVPLVSLVLRAGTHNPILQDMLLSGLEFVEGKTLHDFSITRPEGGIVLIQGEITFAVHVPNVTDLILVQVTIDDENHTLTMSDEDDKIYETSKTLSAGSYTATFTARFDAGNDDEYTVSHAMSFDVDHM